MTKSDIQSILGAKTVSYNSLYAKATGSVTAAVFLSQAVFWQEKAKFKNALETLEIEGESYFSKTGAEWFEETGLSAEQQKTARKPLVLSGILKEKLCGIPARMYFRVDIDALVSGISAYLNQGVTVSGFSANRKAENPRTGCGKFRKQEYGKPANYNIEESFESFESEEERCAAMPLSSSNKTPTFKAEKKSPPLQGGAALAGPFTPTGETIEPQQPTVVRLYDKDLPGVTLVEPAPMPEYQPDPRSTPPAEIRRVNIAEEIEAMRSDQFALEGFVIGRKLPREKFSEYLKDFEAEQIGLKTKYKNERELRLHFLNWSGIHHQAVKRRQTQQNGKGSSITRAGDDLSKYQEKQIF